MNRNSPIIGFCGMTHLGLNSAVATIAKGFEVICFDQNSSLINEIIENKLPVIEPQLNDLLNEHKERIFFSSDVSVLSECDVVYVAPDVPTDDNGKSDLSGITELLSIVIPALKQDSTLVILSQVSPGFTRNLSRENGPIYYQVETLIFGKAIERAMYPERFIIGCFDSSEPLSALYKQYLEAFNCPVLTMRYESAELAKISINMCLVASVSVANTMAEVCEKIGADWSEITPSLRLDKRIGQFSYIEPGLGISGGNLERDLASVIRMSEEYSTDGGVVKAWIDNSYYRKDWPYRTLFEQVLENKPDAKIAILGLSYKENTHSVKNSPSISLLKKLNLSNVMVYDPVVNVDDLDLNIEISGSAYDTFNGADAAVIIAAWSEFKKLSLSKLSKLMAGNVFIDPYHLFERKDAEQEGLQYFTLGVS